MTSDSAHLLLALDQRTSRANPWSIEAVIANPLFRFRAVTLGVVLILGLTTTCTSSKPVADCRAEASSPAVSMVDLGGQVTSVAADGQTLWALRRVGRRGSHSELVQLDPSSGKILRNPVSLPDFGAAVAVASDGVWVTAYTGFKTGFLIQVDASSHRVLARVPVGRRPEAVAIGHGAIWVANSEDSTVSRVDPSHHHVVATIAIRDGPMRIFILGKSVWVQTNNADAPLFRIDPNNNRAVTIPNARMVNVGLGGVWVIGPWAPNGALRRLDPATGHPVGPALAFDALPASIAIAGSDLWVGKLFPCGKASRPEGAIGPIPLALAYFRVDPRTLRALSGPVFVSTNLGTQAFAGKYLWFNEIGETQIRRMDLSKARSSPASPTARLPQPFFPSP
jgi:hypothetical protein